MELLVKLDDLALHRRLLHCDFLPLISKRFLPVTLILISRKKEIIGHFLTHAGKMTNYLISLISLKMKEFLF